jgi:enolase
MPITKLHAREIIDSRGNPTIEVEVWAGKQSAIAAAPSGASTGSNEVIAFPKQGVAAAVKRFNDSYAEKFVNISADFHQVDSKFKELDPGFSLLGGNLAVALSMAVGKLKAEVDGKDFFEIFTKTNNYTMPFPLGNVIGGGAHAGKGSPDFQEYLVIPTGADNIHDAVMANETAHKIVLELIKSKIPNFTKGRNDEGGWAPQMDNDEALEILVAACIKTSDQVGFTVKSGLDLAATQFWNADKEAYVYKNGVKKTPAEQIDYMEQLVDHFGIFYLEDPFHEADFKSFAELTKRVGNQCLVVADDLTVTNPKIFDKCIKQKSANSIIVKPNQIGSLTDTEKVINTAIENMYTPVVSHRSGETTDTSISHIAVGFSAPIIKCGVTGGERIAKLDELLRIAEKTEAGMGKIGIR